VALRNVVDGLLACGGELKHKTGTKSSRCWTQQQAGAGE
jgi:hypothetical protein